MKRLGILVLGTLLSSVAGATTLTGTARDAAGNLLTINGTIWFELNQAGNVLGGGCGGPFQVGPGIPVVFTLTNGAIQTSPAAVIVGNDCIAPSNTYYRETIVTADGAVAVRRNVTITGTTADVGTLTAPSSLPLGTTGVPGSRRVDTTLPLTGGGDLGFDRTFGVSITTTNDGGAVAKQGSSPGTQQATANFNISGTGLSGVVKAGDAGSESAPSFRIFGDTKGFFSAATDDIGLATNGLETFRCGPTTGSLPRQCRFAGPMLIGVLPSGVAYDIGNSGVLETMRVVPRAIASASQTTYNGIVVVNDATGADLTVDSFFHGLTVNIAAQSPLHLGSPSNEVAAGEFFATQYGRGSIFGSESTATVASTATGPAPNIVGAAAYVQDHYVGGTTHDSVARGLLVVTGSKGKVLEAGGTATGVTIERAQLNDYTTGTVNTNGTTTVTCATTCSWLSIDGGTGEPTAIGKKIKIGTTTTTVASIASDTSLTTVDTVPTGSGQSYRIALVNGWTTGLQVRDATLDGISVKQDANFPPSANDRAFALWNTAASDQLWKVKFTGAQEFRGSSDSSPIAWSHPQSGANIFGYSVWTPALVGAGGAIFMDRLTTSHDTANYEQLVVGTDILAAAGFDIFTRKGGTGSNRPLRFGTAGVLGMSLDTASNLSVVGTTTSTRFIGPATALRSATTDVDVTGNTPAAGNVLKATSTTAATWTAPVDVQVFTANGTWTKPANVTTVFVQLVGGGGGGGAGSQGAAGTARTGGGGGGGGAMLEYTFRASDLAATESVTVGAAGAAGAAGVDIGGGPGTGGVGGGSIFKTKTAFGGGGGKGAVVATAGSGGGGGGSGGAGASGGTGDVSGGNPTFGASPFDNGVGGGGGAGKADGVGGKPAEWGGAGGGGTTNVVAAGVGSSSIHGAGSGGCGGGVTTANAGVAGATGGGAGTWAFGGGPGGGASGASGTNGTAGGAGDSTKSGQGGGGGGGATSTTGGTGGAGGIPGGGGGGGGGGTTVAGAGGAGARGEVRVISW